MIIALLWCAVLCSGSVYCAAKFQKRFEIVLPLTEMSLVLILFLFGMCRALRFGIYAVLILSALLYLATGVELVRKKIWRQWLHNLLTPALVIFLLMLCALFVLNRGKLAVGTDEFSHWVDVVKAMVHLDDFATNPQSHSMFQSYPPAMALFQYFLQKLLLLFHPGAAFSEWHVYLAYQVFLFSVLFPFFQRTRFKKPLGIVLSCAVIFIAPLLFFNELFSSVYIDPFLSVLFGAGVSAVLLFEEKPLSYSLYIWLLCTMLTLAKDAGLLFSVFLFLIYCADLLLRRKVFKQWPGMVVALIATVAPKLCWNWNLQQTQAEVMFENKMSLGQLAAVFTGQGEPYRKTVLINYTQALFERSVPVEGIGLAFSYMSILLTEALFLYLLYRAFAKHEPERQHSRLAVFSLLLVQTVVYLIGLCVTYMFNFSEYEAVRLASFERYLNISFLAAYLIILLAAAELLRKYGGKRAQILQVVLLYGICILSPLKYLGSFASKHTVSVSVQKRQEYMDISHRILDVCDGDDCVFVVSQEDSGADRLAIKFSVRPNVVNHDAPYSLGPAFYDGDIWSQEVSPKEWMSMLTESYDYVALHQLNDYFYETYSACFEDPSQIAEGAVFRVSQEGNLLEKCE